jgi:serine protease Do
MKFKMLPVILTAAVTSVMTLFVSTHFRDNTPYFGAARNNSLPVNFTNYSGPASTGAVNFEGAAASSIKAVVHIKTATQAKLITENNPNDVFSQMFGQRQYYIPSQQGSGSGVVISPDGYIVTNNHVVDGASEVTVTFNDRYTAKAKVVGTDPSTDIAVLKVDGETNMPFMEFGNSDDVRLGQWVLAVGFPLNLEATVTAGIVSAKGRSLGINKQKSNSAIESFIQTDAAVNPGNSGGALVNTSGQLIGINSAIASPTGSYAGYSYAIPADIVRKAVNDLMKYGAVQRGYMGVEYFDSRDASADELHAKGLDRIAGVYIMNVHSGSGAANAGLKTGDFITNINGIAVNNPADVQGQIARFQPGDNISVAYNRGGTAYTTTVKLTNLNGTTELMKNGSPAKLMGATFRQLNGTEKKQYNLGHGLVVADPGNGSMAVQTKMRKGFVIMGVNNIPVSTAADLQQALTSNGSVQLSGFYPGEQGMYYYTLVNKGEE